MQVTRKKIKDYIQTAKPSLLYLMSFLLGAINALTMPPIGLFIILPITVSLFILITKSCATRKAAFFNGWLFGAGYFIFSLYWISYALFVDIALWWWVLPLSLLVGPALFGIYWGFIPLLAWRYKKPSTAYAITFCVAWALIEWIRGHALTGFPWNLSGYSWYRFPAINQLNSLVGIYGLTFITLLWAAIPAFKNRTLQIMLLVSFFVALSFGTHRLKFNPVSFYDDIGVRVVQPNIEQTAKWVPEEREKNLRKHLVLTSKENVANYPIKFVVWPETATLYDLTSSNSALRVTSSALPKGSIGVFGSLNVELNDKGEEQFFNSVSFVSSQGKIISTYNKHHLVPFGEYIPFRNYINLTPMAAGISAIGDFSRGTGIATMDLGKDLPKPSPLICYEAIFPSAVASKQARPDWLLNVTNDAWYGNSAGPYQHFENVRVRAIEEGLPLVRSANNGISGVIDPLGRVIDKQPLFATGIIDSKLPKPLEATIYSKFGDGIFFIVSLLLIGACEISRRRYK